VIIMKLSKIVQKFDVFRFAKFRGGGGGGGAPNFLTEFYKSGLPSDMWQSLVMIGQVTSGD